MEAREVPRIFEVFARVSLAGFPVLSSHSDSLTP